MTFIFQYGQYAGKSVAQVALADYSYIRFMLTDRIRKGASGNLTEELRMVANKLNNFIPKVPCRFPDGCSNLADHLSIRLTYGDIPRGDFSRHGVIGVSASTEYAGCREHIDYIASGDSKTSKYPIRFDALSMLPEWPKWVRQDVQKVLLECAGFSGKKTLDNCERFIRTLEQRV
jgi:hypothetical protein